MESTIFHQEIPSNRTKPLKYDFYAQSQTDLIATAEVTMCFRVVARVNTVRSSGVLDFDSEGSVGHEWCGRG